MASFNDLTGQTFGKLKAIKPLKERRNGRVVWQCRCVCGNETNLPSSSLILGNTKSCGCLRVENGKILGTNNKVHGESSIDGTRRYTKLYKIWIGMNNRCSDPSRNDYMNYGGRGIRVCKEWVNDYLAFSKYVRKLPNCPADDILYSRVRVGSIYSLDRKNNNKNYQPGNIRWATIQEQQSNKRSSILVSYKGKQRTLTETVRLFSDRSYTTVRKRLKEGWALKKALKN